MPGAKALEIEIRLSRTVRTELEELYPPCGKMIAGILETQGVQRAGISLAFVGRDKIRQLNREYLGRKGQTDVLAFDLSAGVTGDKERVVLGDIYICVPRAFEQAAQLGLAGREELFRLAAHGVLHILGYDHENREDAGRMFELQEQAVKEYSGF